MQPDTYQQLAARTEAPEAKPMKRMHQSYNVRLTHAVFGLLTESGELADTLKRHIYYGQPLDRVNVEEELGDIMWYVALACNALGLSLDEVLQANTAKLRARFPDQFTERHAKEENRDREAESRALTLGSGKQKC